jgi:TolB protein
MGVLTSSIRVCAAALCLAASACVTSDADAPRFQVVGAVETFAPGVVTTPFSELRLAISRDGNTALWFSRNRPGGAGGYDIWMSRREGGDWSAPAPVSFNTGHREFDPAFTADGAYVYFCSDRPGGAGGDDIYRVRIAGDGFGEPEHLGPNVNSAGNEWAPMLSRGKLLFSSNGRGGAGRFDLFVARERGDGFEAAEAVSGEINTSADEFDATFLADGASIVFSRAPDLQRDRIDLFFAAPQSGRYDAGAALPLGVNHDERDTYAPMLDWSQPDRISFSARRADERDMEVYLVRYRITR